MHFGRGAVGVGECHAVELRRYCTLYIIIIKSFVAPLDIEHLRLQAHPRFLSDDFAPKGGKASLPYNFCPREYGLLFGAKQ